MIYELLRNGEEKAVSMSELARRIGTSERQIRKQVNEERRAGLPILSGIHGYYLPSQDPEIAKHQLIAFQRQQRKHAISHADTAGIAGNLLKALTRGTAE